MVTVWTGVCAAWMTRLAVPRVAWLSAGTGSTFTEMERAAMTRTALRALNPPPFQESPGARGLLSPQ